jgi:hypothetical protein
LCDGGGKRDTLLKRKQSHSSSLNKKKKTEPPNLLYSILTITSLAVTKKRKYPTNCPNKKGFLRKKKREEVN